MNLELIACLFALLGCTGGALCVAYWTRGRRRSFDERIAVQCGHGARQAPTWRELRSPWRRPASHAAAPSSVAGASADHRLAARLELAGSTQDPSGFRAGRILWALGGGAAATVFFVLIGTRTALNPLATALAVVAATVAGVWLHDVQLTSATRRRRARMAAQFPALAELLALAVAAGDGIGSAIARAARDMRGDLASELKKVLHEISTGVPLTSALEGLARRLDVPSVSRFVDAVVVASERGTPLAGVLRDQAADARESARRSLMEAAGKREIGMLAPVVFGVLPLSVLFAVFPGLSLFNLSV